MFLATTNKVKQLLLVSYIGKVGVEELRRGREEAAVLLAELEPGFRALVDLERLDEMDTECAEELGRLMELCGERGVAVVVRVIPDPKKDIGLGILSHFHYKRPLEVVNCCTMVEAAGALSL